MGVIFSSRATRIHFPDKPAYVSVAAKDECTESRLSLRNLLETKCPSLFEPFVPSWWLFNGHLQTIYCVLGDFTKTDKVIYDRKYLRLQDGGTLGLDFAPSHASVREDAPVIVVLHGLTGGSYESYVRCIVHPACTPEAEGGLGYRAVVVNFRGCANVPITSQQLYSAGHTDDIRLALMYISKLYPKAPLLGLGFSLGSNVMTRYIAEEGEKSRLVAGCALACPWDLACNNNALNSTLIGKHIYARGMGSNLLNLLKKHIQPLSKDPEHRVAKALITALELNNPTMEEFDNTFTRIAGGSPPTFPFDSATDYYNWASSHKVLGDVKVPFLAVNAADDPVVQDVPMHGGDSGYVVMALTPKGGHLGWFEKDHGLDVKRWVTKPVLQWLRLMGTDVIHGDMPRGRPLHVSEDGFLREEGNDSIGCREIDGGGEFEGMESEAGLLQGL
ncbi:hypothetical protein PC9H_000826 [Pleurotus ostreatus]|uniref:AB hydrolase-1 domain-containing protein n=2 Tax=Pleurotus ostreatus TaxID=5322 RepID=A0A067NYX3_PLEO1|nr:uncharacterized protein PC9H_000826 [Pleurotus ostreatus]KAF7440481.1 hypothetical protein PC9H_000826 [Pleurotus ostreatus]KAJ8700171.1 hypothetical protein PTI98_003223 [Pleurotus ostreatus]KDQ33273.1 hypothetical protein PLEOSDRAFT_1033138 [Pleurotus ostreatus PC15]